MSVGDVQGPASPAAVVAAATRHFLAGERVDMQVLATEAGVGRSTLYRWFGDRECILGHVLWALSEETLSWLADEAPDVGHDQVLATIEAFMAVTSGFAPLRRFLAAEPAVALRTLLEPRSPLVVALGEWTGERLEAAGYGDDRAGARELAEVLVSVTSTYCWARIVAGSEADVEGAMRAVRVLLRSPN